MHLYELTRKLIDIESITENEEAMGRFLMQYLTPLALENMGKAEILPVAPKRFNVFCSFGKPIVTMSTHMDTVPPFFASSEDEEFIHGRGACDVKGIIAAMIKAAERLLETGTRNFGLLFVVGEERNSLGAYTAAKTPRGSKFLINGEPTENKLAVGSKGALRLEVRATGKMAHSAYPELGESAINKLLDVLARMRALELPSDEVLGATTINIGTLAGGRAPNVIADEARASVMVRLVSDPAPIREAVNACLQGQAELDEILCIPAVHLGTLPGFETTVVSYTTDIPALGDAWGKPYLLGPGTIHLAHTAEERVPKAELEQAVGLYTDLVRQLLCEGALRK